jgi:hypothetical protein
MRLEPGGLKAIHAKTKQLTLRDRFQNTRSLPPSGERLGRALIKSEVFESLSLAHEAERAAAPRGRGTIRWIPRNNWESDRSGLDGISPQRQHFKPHIVKSRFDDLTSKKPEV